MKKEDFFYAFAGYLCFAIFIEFILTSTIAKLINYVKTVTIVELFKVVIDFIIIPIKLITSTKAGIITASIIIGLTIIASLTHAFIETERLKQAE